MAYPALTNAKVDFASLCSSYISRQSDFVGSQQLPFLPSPTSSFFFIINRPSPTLQPVRVQTMASNGHASPTPTMSQTTSILQFRDVLRGLGSSQQPRRPGHDVSLKNAGIRRLQRRPSTQKSPR
jgi:hypothetical protein